MTATNLTYTPQNPTVLSVYGRLPEIPEGYEVVEFRPVKETDGFFLNHGFFLNRAETLERGTVIHEPRLILRKKPEREKVDGSEFHPVSVRDIYSADYVEIPEGWKYRAFCPPVTGEKFLYSGRPVQVHTAFENFPLHLPRIIVTKVCP